MKSLRLFSLTILLVPFLGAQAPKTTPATQAPAQDQPVHPPLPEEDLLVIKTVPYKPALVRDPFRAPSDMELSKQGDMVDDVGVKGRVVLNGKVMVVITDSRGNTRSLPVGYKFRDGEIVSIDEKEVVFHQWDVSSTNRSVFRTVRRPFKREEGKR